MKGDYYPFRLGRFQCFSLCDGKMDYKLEAMVRNAPPADIAAALQAHGLPTEVIATPYAYLYVQTGRHNVMVDMGAGDFAASTGGLLESLAAAGGKPEAIDAVFITHAHPDHVGGALNATGELNFSKSSAAHFQRQALVRPGRSAPRVVTARSVVGDEAVSSHVMA